MQTLHTHVLRLAELIALDAQCEAFALIIEQAEGFLPLMLRRKLF